MTGFLGIFLEAFFWITSYLFLLFFVQKGIQTIGYKCTISVILFVTFLIILFSVHLIKTKGKGTWRKSSKQKFVKFKTSNPYPNSNYVFISYKHESTALKKIDGIEGLDSKLTEEKIKFWYDSETKNHVGLNFDDKIAEQIVNCKIFLPLIDKQYLSSRYCQDELNYAIVKGKLIFPVFLENVTLRHGIEMRLSSIEAIQFDNKNSFYKTLFGNINKELKKNNYSFNERS